MSFRNPEIWMSIEKSLKAKVNLDPSLLSFVVQSQLMNKWSLNVSIYLSTSNSLFSEIVQRSSDVSPRLCPPHPLPLLHPAFSPRKTSSRKNLFVDLSWSFRVSHKADFSFMKPIWVIASTRFICWLPRWRRRRQRRRRRRRHRSRVSDESGRFLKLDPTGEKNREIYWNDFDRFGQNLRWLIFRKNSQKRKKTNQT